MEACANVKLFLLAVILQLVRYQYAVAADQSSPSTCDDQTVVVQDGSGSRPRSYCSRALGSVLNNAISYTTIRLNSSGEYTLDDFVLVQDVTNLTLEGIGGDSDAAVARIRCEAASSAGLAFVNVSQLSISNVVVDGCGFTGEDLKHTTELINDFIDLFYSIPSSAIRVSLLFGHCEDLRMENVSISNTRGFGLVGINVIGSSELKNVRFFNNTNPGPCMRTSSRDVFNPSPEDLSRYETLGGAASFMYFDYLTETYQGNRLATLDLVNCNFSSNAECSLTYLSLLRSPGRGESSLVASAGHTLGGSGALTLALGQLQFGITIRTTSSHFYNNSATFGSGSTIALFKGVRNSHVVFNNCSFNESAVVFFNDVRRQEVQNSMTGDANVDSNRNVTFSVLSSNFSNTIDVIAGSTLLVYSNYYSGVDGGGINVYVDNCLFENNRATVGSAVAIYEHKIDGFGAGMQVVIKDTDFIKNQVISSEAVTKIAISQSASTLNIMNVNLTLQGNCSFVDNVGTALYAESSLVGVSGNITFLRNTGINGGALTLVAYAYLIMNRNSSIYFIDNRARIGGGAIYVNEGGLSSYLIGGYVDCFLQFSYDNFIVCENCSDLNSYNVYFKFTGNTAAHTGSVISGSSLITCPWAQPLIKNGGPDRSLFDILIEDYHNIFDVDQPESNSTSNLVQSMSSRLQIVELTPYTTNGTTDVFPGQVFQVNISAFDDFNQTISNIITAFATPSDSPHGDDSLTPLLGSTGFAVLESNRPTTVPVQILGPEDQDISLVVYSTDSAGRAQMQLDIKLLSCGFGFEIDPTNSTCLCDSKLNNDGNGISCSSETHVITVQDGAWIGLFRGETIVDRCISRYCEPGERKVNINGDSLSDIDFDVQCDPSTNRIGFLCSECREGYSAVLGTRNCRRCTNWFIFLFIFFLAVGVLAVFIVQYLNISITAGFINGAIFYSNIVTIYGRSIVPGDTYNEALALIAFPSLNLGFETCLYNRMTILHKVLWQLSFPLYLFMLMFIISLIARSKHVKLKESTGSSVIQTFATLLILCYVSVLGACAELIAFNRIYKLDRDHSPPFFLQWRSDPSVNYFGKEHFFPGIIACLVLLLYILPLPFLLLFPSLLYGNKYASKYKPILDAFWYPYKPGYRFFLGLLLMFRWLPFFLVATVRPPTSIFATTFFLILLLLVQSTVQPYREKWQNYVESAFLCNLVLLLTGSIFFWSEYNGIDVQSDAERERITVNSLIYSNTLIVLGFLLMLGILAYHVYIRFPTLQQFVKRLSLKWSLDGNDNAHQENGFSDDGPSSDATNQSEEAQDSAGQTGDVRNGATINPLTTMPPVVTTVALREPLLESGSLSLYDIESDPRAIVPSRVQSIITNFRRSDS